MNAVAHIGPSIQIKGEITAQEPLIIAGHVEGIIDVSGHPLTVTEVARIDADVLAHTVIVGGSVNGRISAEGRIVVQQTATVTGDVSAPSVSVHDGALVQGRLDIEGRRKTAAASAAA